LRHLSGENKGPRVRPAVSVIIPCYRHERYVDACLRSIDSQTIGPLEIIVIDDGSIDETWAHIQDFKFSPKHEVVRIRQPNQGAHEALNQGLRRARGEWVALCNSDDLFHVERLERMQAAVSRAGGRFGFSGVWYLDEHGADVSTESEYAADLAGKQAAIEQFPTVGWALVLSNVAISTGNFFFKRELLDEVGIFRPYRLVHDWDFILRSLLVTEPVYVPDRLYGYRLHGTNSFTALMGEVAARECPELMRRYFKAACRRRPANRLAPSPSHWPVFYEVFVKEHSYQPYLAGWEGIDEPFYRPEGVMIGGSLSGDRHGY